MIKVLVCGGRGYTESEPLRRVLEAIANHSSIHIAHGGAKGADEAAGEIAKYYNWPCSVYKADWEANGKSAGFVRNAEMLADFLPNIVVACKGGKGTEHMKNIAMKYGFPVVEVVQ